jgi:ATP-dependent DNA helicase RecG
MHRDWFIDGANVFVEIYTDRIEVVSPGSLPKGMTLSDLGRKSVRRNALIADLLRRIDFIEKAGTGVKRIRDEAREGGYPEPEWEADGFVTTIFRPNPAVRAQVESRPAEPLAPQVGTKSGLSRDQVDILIKCRENRALVDLIEVTGRSNRTKFRDQVLNPLIEASLIEMTIPDKPRSSKQRYRITQKGLEYLMAMDRKG